MPKLSLLWAATDDCARARCEYTLSGHHYMVRNGRFRARAQHDPPFPKDFEYSFTLPTEIPIDVTAEGVVTATSGDYMVQETVELTIKKSGGTGGLRARIFKR